VILYAKALSWPTQDIGEWLEFIRADENIMEKAEWDLQHHYTVETVFQTMDISEMGVSEIGVLSVTKWKEGNENVERNFK
jgi:hypothetical protein